MTKTVRLLALAAVLLYAPAYAQVATPPTPSQMSPAMREEMKKAPPESLRKTPPVPAGRTMAVVADPTTLPRIQLADVKRLGSITLPAGIGSPNCLAVEGDLLYVCTYGGGKTGVAVVRIPALGGTATLVSGPSQLPNLNQLHMGGTYTDVIASGIMPWNGRIGVGGTLYYDGSSGQVRSQWVGTATQHTGPYEMIVSDVGQWTDGTVRWRQSFVGGFKGIIPVEWRTAFGGPALSGGCCFPIIYGRSLGPSASVYNPDDVGVVNPIPSKMIVGYPYEHPTLGKWEDSPPKPYYGGTDQMGSVGFPGGSRSVLFTSRHGDNMCYGPGTSNMSLVGTIDKNVSAYPYCFDPYDSAQGNHGPPYRPIMTAYDANDLVKVKQGLLKPWDVQPYAKWTLPDLPLDRPWYLRAGWWDEARRWYLVGDTSSNEIQVFGIGSSIVPPPTPPVTVSDTYTTGTVPFTVAVPGVLTNDDLKGNTDVTAVLVSGSNFTLNPNGSFTFAPAAGFTGTATMTYQARSVAAGNSNTGTVSVTVTSVPPPNTTTITITNGNVSKICTVTAGTPTTIICP